MDKRFFNLFNLTEDQAIVILETPIKELEDPSEKYIAVSHLINFDTEKTIQALIRAIETSNVAEVDERIVRRKAIESLGRLKAVSALATIQTCLKDDDKYTIENAVWAIGEISSESNGEIKSWTSTGVELGEAIAAVLDRPDQIYRVIIQTLVKLDYKPSVDRIRQFTTAADEPTRSAAIAAVYRFTGDPTDIGQVVQLLQSQNVNSRRAAIQDLMDATYALAIPDIVKCPVSVVFRLRGIRFLAQAGVAAGTLDFATVMPSLDAAIADHPRSLQLIHSYQKTPTLDELMSLLYETDFGICYLATQTLLNEMPDAAPDDVPDALLATYKAEGYNDYGAHYHVIKILGWLQYAPAYDLIVKEGLFNPEPQFQKSRAAAAIALGEIGDVRAIPELKKVLETRIWDLKYAALMALEKLGDLSGHAIAANDADWLIATRAKARI